MSDVIAAIETLRAPGVGEAAIVAGAYLLLNVLFVPATPLNLVCGYLGGLGVGLALAAPARVAAAAISFALARTVLRRRFDDMAAGRPRLRALDGALAASGTRVVALLRLSPLLPSSVSSFALGVSSVRARDFVLGTAIGTLPSSILHVSIGAGLASARDAIERGDMTTAELALLWTGVAATAVAVVLLARRARTELSGIPGEDREPGPVSS